VDAGPPCRPNVATDCPATAFCRLATCGATTGTCTKVPAIELATFNPVCGCDHVTYWNESIALEHRVSLATTGACLQPDALDCTKDGPACPNGGHCSYDVVTKSQCSGNPTGSCWILPAVCPVVGAPGVKSCQNICLDGCQAITLQAPFYTQGVNGCP
jgi:hypothetical protein